LFGQSLIGVLSLLANAHNQPGRIVEVVDDYFR
jgi:hypothetical protein